MAPAPDAPRETWDNRGKMPRTHELELLATARNAEIGIEAIRRGADAVYIDGLTAARD